MKARKTFLSFICGATLCLPALADSPVIILNGGYWWERIGPQLCKISTQKCYSNMSSGAYCSNCWDADGNCWGEKNVCENALKTGYDYTTLSKSQIASAVYINTDFDINTESESDGCFGVRKTYNNGALASVNGEKVKVWCNNVPLSSDNIEIVKSGQVILDNIQPTCESLSENGFAAIQNGSCWGKKYSNKYYIDCQYGQLEPYRIIDINGAMDIDPYASRVPDTYEQIKTKFQTMLKNSRTQHDKHF